MSEKVCDFSEPIPRGQQGWKYLRSCTILVVNPFCGLKGESLKTCEQRMNKLERLEKEEKQSGCL